MNMEQEQTEEQQYNEQQGHHPPPPVVYDMPPIYGYIDPEWEAHNAMMQQYHQQGYEYPHPLHHPMEGVPLPPGIPGLGGSTDPLEAVLGPFPCARLRSLPFDATLEDILILFQGLVVIDVVLVGKGEAFVIFANPMDYQMALQRDRQTIGRSFVEIKPGSRSDYYSAIATQQWQEQQGGPPGRSGDEKLRGDDHRDIGATGSESSGWGSSVGMSQSLPSQGLNRGPHSSGIGSRADEMRRFGPSSLGMGPMRGAPTSRLSSAGVLLKRTGGGIQVGEHTGFLRMRGLPFSATREDIYNFFEDYNPIPESIVLTYRSDGRATGEAYVGFESPDDSKRAMDLHRKTMGSRYIELFLSNKEEHGRALARFGDR